MRLFVALDLDDNIRGRIGRFLDGVRGFAPEARWVRPESLHVTLKFIGERSGEEAERIKQGLTTIVVDSFEMSFRGLGFFPGVRAPRVFWVGIEAVGKLSALVTGVDKTLVRLGIPEEEHAFNPHLTLARSKGGSSSPRKQEGDSPNQGFLQLQERLGALPTPEFGTMTPCEFFLSQSQLSPNGSRYAKVAKFPLR